MAFYVAHPVGFNRASAERSLNIVLLAEAFLPHREGAFLMEVDSFAQTLLRTAPFDRHRDLVTVCAIFTPSAVSLAHLKPGDECAWRDTIPNGHDKASDNVELTPNTPFGALFCRGRNYLNQPVPHHLSGNLTKVWAEIDAEPRLKGLVCAPLVLVDNNRCSGGLNGGFTDPSAAPVASSKRANVGWFSLEGDWTATAIHELGHSFFGLADEYDNNGPPAHSANEPHGPNATLASTRAKLLDAYKEASRDRQALRVWHQLMRPGTPAPTSKPNPGCTPQVGQQEGKILLPPGETGLFEGADDSPCNVFRPRLSCMMRVQHHQQPFCPVCEWAIETKFAQSQDPLRLLRDPQPLGATWTNVLTFDELLAPATENAAATKYLFYNFLGNYEIRPISKNFGQDLKPDPLTTPGSQTDGAWTTLLSFAIGEVPYVAAHSLLLRRLAFYKVANVGGVRLLALTFDSGVGGYAFTHMALFASRDAPHLIGYDCLSGAIAIGRIDSDAAAPTLVYGTAQDSARRWPTGFTVITAFTVDGVPHVLRHNAASGEVQVQSLDPPGFGPMTFVSGPRHWCPGATSVVAYETNHRTYVVRASPGSYRAYDWIWPRGAGVETVLREDGCDVTIALAFLRVDSAMQGRVEAVVALTPNRRLGPPGSAVELIGSQ